MTVRFNFTEDFTKGTLKDKLEHIDITSTSPRIVFETVDGEVSRTFKTSIFVERYSVDPSKESIRDHEMAAFKLKESINNHNKEQIPSGVPLSNVKIGVLRPVFREDVAEFYYRDGSKDYLLVTELAVLVYHPEPEVVKVTVDPDEYKDWVEKTEVKPTKKITFETVDKNWQKDVERRLEEALREIYFLKNPSEKARKDWSTIENNWKVK